MSNETTWSQRITENAQYQQISTLAEEVKAAEVEHPSNEAKLSYDRILKTVLRLQTNLNLIEPDLISPNLIQGIHGQFNGLTSQIKSYLSSPSIGHLNNAQSHVDALIQGYPFLFIPQELEATPEHSKLLQSYNNTANGYLGALKNAKLKLDESVEATKTEAANLKKEIETYKGELSTLRQENSKISSQQNETFIKSQQDRDEKYGEFKESVQSELNTQLSEQKTEFDNNLEDFEKRADERVKKIEDMLGDATRAFENLGVHIQTGSYQRFADKEAKAAHWLRIGAIVALVLMFLGTLYVIISAEKEQLPWNLFLLRFLTVATLSIPAFYFARESTRHRAKEQNYRKIQLELTSLPSFIKSLDEAKKKEITEELIEKYFGREEAPPVDDDQLLTKKDLMEIIAKIPTN